MKTFLVMTQINFKRLIYRNLRFFSFDILLPALFYLLFTKVMNQGLPTNFKKTYLISMVIFATLLSSIITISNNTLDDKEQHLWRLIKVTPLKKITYYTSFFVTMLFLTVIEIMAIELVAIILVGVKLTFSDFLIITLGTALGSIVLMMWGAIITYLGDASMINLVASMLTFPIAMISGLWWPLSMFPNWMQKIGELLPTYQTTDIINYLIKQHQWQWSALLGELCWLIISMIIMIAIQQKQS